MNFQYILVWVLFLFALIFIGVRIYKSFSNKEAGTGGCESCEGHIPKTVKNKKGA